MERQLSIQSWTKPLVESLKNTSLKSTAQSRRLRLRVTCLLRAVKLLQHSLGCSQIIGSVDIEKHIHAVFVNKVNIFNLLRLNKPLNCAPTLIEIIAQFTLQHRGPKRANKVLSRIVNRYTDFIGFANFKFVSQILWNKRCVVAASQNPLMTRLCRPFHRCQYTSQRSFALAWAIWLQRQIIVFKSDIKRSIESDVADLGRNSIDHMVENRLVAKQCDGFVTFFEAPGNTSAQDQTRYSVRRHSQNIAWARIN